MSLRALKPLAAIGALALGWIIVIGVAFLTGRATPLDAKPPPPPRWVVVKAPPSTKDWTHFLACSGLTADPELMRATLVLNKGGDEAIWRGSERRETPVRLALVPVSGPLGPQAERIISDAPGAVADCGETP